MDRISKFKLLDALILLNERKIEECKDTLLEIVEENSIPHFRALLKLVEILIFIRERQAFNFEREIDTLFKIMEEIEEDDFGIKFKEMLFQIVEFLNYPTNKRRIFINWQIIFSSKENFI